MKKNIIWLVEDDRATRRLLTHFLSKESKKYIIEEFEYAEDVLKKLNKKEIIPQLIIFDNILKGKVTGIDAIENIRISSDIPILLYSATPTSELLDRCINLKMVRYLSKPIKPIELDFHIKSLFKVQAVKEQLKASESRYRVLFNESTDMMFISNPEGKFLDINPSGVKMLGYNSKEELLNIEIPEKFYVNPGDRERFIKEISEKGYVKDFQTKIRKKDNTEISIIESSSLVKDKDNKNILYLGIVRDITKQIEDELNLIKMNVEQIQINEKLKEAQSVLIHQEKMASLGNLAAGIAHEINNPLGFVVSNFKTLRNYMLTIKTYLELLENKNQNKYLKSDIIKSKAKVNYIMEDIEDLFKESTDGFDRISEIVKNMRQFSRVDSEDEKSYVNINDAIKNTLVISRNSYKYITEINLELNDIPEIKCNVSEINQVLLNIIVNAAQAIEQQKKNEKGKITIRTYVEEGMVCCSIEDNGPGIPEKYIKKVFDPFFTTKEIGKGTGMGLSISYDIIVNKHKGKLSVESNKDKGTVFIIKLRQVLEDKPEGE